MFDTNKSIQLLLTNELDRMDQGAIQEFARDFLPCVGTKYKNLDIIGGTKKGRTRKGTPDLICTLNDGSQIAVQCSVKEKYWHVPESPTHYEAWKPCEDIDKCVDHLPKLSEVVLFSSQQLPSNAANAYSIIREYCKQKYENRFELTFFNGTVIVEKLAQLSLTTLAHSLLKTFFPDTSNIQESLVEGTKAVLTIDIYKNKPNSSLKNIQEILESTIKHSGLKPDSIKKETIANLDNIKPLYEKSIPSLGLVKRKFPKEFNLDPPIGKIISILGLPKIGKTTLVGQLVQNWKNMGFQIKWFQCPCQSEFSDTFVISFLHNILSLFFPNDVASDISYKRQPVSIIESLSINPSSLDPTLFVVDNFELLSDLSLSSLFGVLSYLKSKNLLEMVGIIFISSNRRNLITSLQDKELYAPKWEANELIQFIGLYKPTAKGLSNPKYVEILCSLSGGHPHIALSLCLKYPDSASELLISGIKAPTRMDEGFSREIKAFLYDNILKDTDSRIFVSRLSNIFRAADEEMLIFLKRHSPEIITPLEFLLSQLKGVVLEGDNKFGFEVALIYKEITRNLLNVKDKMELYQALAKYFLRVEGRIIDFDKVEQGLYYAVSSNNFQKAFDWANILLMSLFNNSKLENKKKKIILDRIKFLSFLPVTYDIETLSLKYLMIAGISAFYEILDQFLDAEEAENLLVLPLDLDESNHSETIRKVCAMADISKVMRQFKKSPDSGLQQLCQVDVYSLMALQPDAFANLIELIGTSYILFKSQKHLQEFLKKMLANENMLNINHMKSLVSISQAISLLAHANKSEYIHLTGLDGNTPLVCILSAIARATYIFNDKKYSEALQALSEARQISTMNSLLSTGVKIEILQLEGDCHFAMQNYSEAISSFTKELDLIAPDENTYSYAWANYRIGLIHTDAVIAENYLQLASEAFKANGYLLLHAKAEGELSVLYAIRHNYTQFLKIASYLVDVYFSESGNNSFGAACAIILSHIGRIQKSFDNKGENEPDNTVPIQRMVHYKTPDDLKPSLDESQARLALSILYSSIGESAFQQKQLLKLVDIEAHKVINPDYIAIAYKYLIPLYLTGKESAQLIEIWTKGVSKQKYDGINRVLLSFCLFSALDNQKPDLKKEEGEILIESLEKLEQTLKLVREDNLDWWIAELRLRIARLFQIILHDKKKAYVNFYLSFNKALNSNNNQMVYYAGYPPFLRSCPFSGLN
jgi:hypothetical protein